jgi:hypothetical protein
MIKENMIKEFGKKGYKGTKKLMRKLEKKKETLHRQEDLLILEKERNLALEKALAEEKGKVEKLTIDLSLSNDSYVRMSKECALANDSLGQLKNSHSIFQESFSCLEVKYKDLEVNYGALWESTSSNPKAILYSNASTSEGCSRCYNVGINACLNNIAKLKETIKAKDNQMHRLNMLVKNSYEGDVKPEPKIKFKPSRRAHLMDWLGHIMGEKVNGRQVVRGWECVKFKKVTKLGELMDMAHGVTKNNVIQPKPTKIKKEATTKIKKVTHEPSPSYTADYMVTMDHHGKMVVMYMLGPTPRRPS